MCNDCRLFLTDSQLFASSIMHESSLNPIIHLSKQISNVLEHLQNGLVITNEMAYKQFLNLLEQIPLTYIPQMVHGFGQYLDHIVSKHSQNFPLYCPIGKKHGSVCTTMTKYSTPCPSIYMYTEKHKLESEVNVLKS